MSFIQQHKYIITVVSCSCVSTWKIYECIYFPYPNYNCFLPSILTNFYSPIISKFCKDERIVMLFTKLCLVYIYMRLYNFSHAVSCIRIYNCHFQAKPISFLSSVRSCASPLFHEIGTRHVSLSNSILIIRLCFFYKKKIEIFIVYNLMIMMNWLY